MSASAACLIHCLVLPLIVAFLPVWAEAVDATESMHIWVLLFAIPASLFALIPTTRRTQSKRNLMIGVLGLSLLCAG